jgi:2-C-methyl-D-erythritol 2,4-cyclodiphosphate synthase
MIRDQGYEVGNVDSTICLQEPRVKPYIASMRTGIARHMGVESGIISVKATTEEGLGFTGTKEGISAYAAALIVPRGNPGDSI